MKMLVAGTVMDIPFTVDISAPDTDLSYTILFDNGTTSLVSLSEMADIIPSPPVCDINDIDSNSLLPPFLQLNSKITYEHDGQYHKGFLGIRNWIYCFMFKSHVNKRKEDWGVPLPNLPQTWVDLCVEGVLVPGHVTHSFLWQPSSSTPSTFDPVASFVSVLNLHWDCPPTLLRALVMSHPDREVCLQRYYEEKRGIESLSTF
jgi:hypothetical protein